MVYIVKYFNDQNYNEASLKYKEKGKMRLIFINVY